MAGAGMLAALMAVGVSSPITFDAETLPSHHAANMASAAGPTDRPKTVTTPIACEKLPNVPGKSITTVLVDFPPRAFTPAHRHPGSVTAFVLKGTLRSQLNNEEPRIYGVAGTWFEPPGTLHTFVENPSPTDSAQLLAIFVADTDCGPLTIFER
jgi:quercetin dioxygenase-like cupin family protein